MTDQCPPGHSHDSALTALNARDREGLTVIGRRSMLKASLRGMAGLTLADLLCARRTAAASGRAMGGSKSVILLWMAGGPSHIDTWDQGQRTLSSLCDKDLHEEVVAPAGSFSFAFDAVG